jgi:hypothetical protein
MAGYVLKLDQEIPISLTFTDMDDNPVSVDSVPLWLNSDDTIVTVVPADDGMSAIVLPVGPQGEARISVSVDENYFHVLHVAVEAPAPDEISEPVEVNMGQTTLKAIVNVGPSRMQPIP